MSKFSQFASGLKARKLFDLPLLRAVDAPAPAAPAQGEVAVINTAPASGVRSVTVALVPFFGGTEVEVLKSARNFARQNGVENPKPGEPIYERGLWLYTVLRSVMDADVTHKDDPFFESLDQILSMLDPGRISLLFHAQRAWQAKCAPAPETMAPSLYIQHILELAHAAEEEDRTGEMYEVPFDHLPVDLQLRFSRRLARQFSTWISTRSLSGSDTPDDRQSSRNGSQPSPSTGPTKSTSKDAPSAEGGAPAVEPPRGDIA